MIRIIQRIVVVFFAVSVIFFAVSTWKVMSASDTEGPKIQMDSDSITVSIEATDDEIMAGMTASDSKDGDVTDSMVIQGMTNFIEKGRRQAVIAAFDSDNNVAKVKREIIYSDYISPRFSLDAPLRFPVNSTFNLATAFRVVDCLDGDISGRMTISADDSFSTEVAGEYSLVFQISNSAGDVAELPVTVEYYDVAEDSRYPKVALTDYLIYVNKGEKIDPWDYVEGIVYNGLIYDFNESGDDGDATEDAMFTKNDIRIDNPVKTSETGIYEIVYSIDGNAAGEVKIRLIVIVE